MDFERLSNRSLGVKDRRHYKLFMHAYVWILNKRIKFLIIKPTRCTNLSKFYSWNETLHVSETSSVHHQEIFTVHTTNLYDIYHCYVYSEKLLMMDRGTVRNMQSFIPRIKFWEISASSWFYYKRFITMHDHMNVKRITVYCCWLEIKGTVYRVYFFRDANIYLSSIFKIIMVQKCGFIQRRFRTLPLYLICLKLWQCLLKKIHGE